MRHEVVGKQITLFPSTTQFNGQNVPYIRVSAPTAATNDPFGGAAPVTPAAPAAAAGPVQQAIVTEQALPAEEAPQDDVDSTTH